ncbi:hypothetical protein SAMN05660831_01408 [Thiohalospira halophila DSM 15071]|uniref:Uncharacterized protein n=1 Tax=Thiohalospira halophila DSM 15071 TaxID=1123397 RepID=A0A1I1RKD5_9GAMM|nr:hypothetical protein [Thiohalospira halophila]SFD32083.1 hypothetical protein SAMN05660831_01408 [Thiohalospira halophila DSM 15071]
MDIKRPRTLVSIAALAGLVVSAAATGGEVVLRERPDGTQVITDAPGTGGNPDQAGEERPESAGPGSGGSSEPGSDRAGPDLTSGRPPSGGTGGSPAAVPNYTVAIRSPAADAVIWADDARLAVSVAVEPTLAAGDRLRVRLGEHARATADGSGELELFPVHRGSYPLRAAVVDPAGKVLAESPPRTIHVKQHSRLRSGTAD